MSTMTVREFALALARPLVRRAGNDETVLGGVRDRARARELLAKLWAARTPGEVVSVLDYLSGWSTANELDSYLQSAATMGWKPHERDLTMVRKAAMAPAIRAEVGERALLGWDVSRYALVVGWAAIAGLLDEAKGLALLRAKLDELRGLRKSFADVAREVALGHRWTFGSEDQELDRVIAALPPLPWPRTLKGPAAKSSEDDEGLDAAILAERPAPLEAPVSLAVSVSVDCPACGSPLHFRELAAGETCPCGARVPMEREDWVYLLEADVRRFAPEQEGNGELTQDFGDKWFSRRSVRREAPRCPRCDGALALDALLAAATSGSSLACGACHEPVRVRAADDVLRAIHPEARAIAGEVAQGYTVRPADVACLGCGSILRAGGASRILRCTCGARTFVDDAAWRSIAGPERRPRWILLLGPAP